MKTDMRLFCAIVWLSGCTDYVLIKGGPLSEGDDTAVDKADAEPDDPPDDGLDDTAGDPPDDPGPPDDPPPPDDPGPPDDDPPPPDDPPPDDPPPDDPPDDPSDDPPPPDDPSDDPPPPADSFTLGWHILDEGVHIGTTSNPSRTVDFHGDPDVYWYEPSGQHGLLESTDLEGDFEAMRDYVIERVPVPTHGIGLLHYYADSDIDTFAYATFTYILCDFIVETGDDPFLYELSTGPVDDGIQVMINGTILGHVLLDEPGDSWDLGSYIRLDERNTVIVILVDDSATNKFVQDLGFSRDGTVIMGGPTAP